ncbi:MAG: ADP-glyceromanno-heptose 6-epimerase [Candidatus Binataceae bacterium]
MIIVTGGAGFIGSNIVAALNAEGRDDILIIDRLGDNFRNLVDLRFRDFVEPEEFRNAIRKNGLRREIETIFHQGACADTTSSDGHYMMDNNFSFSKELLRVALQSEVPFVYASSASVYGSSRTSQITVENERPLNLYAFSKLAFDNHVRGIIDRAKSTVIGLRYFNVYGPRERHKGKMASMVYQLYRQLSESGRARLFEGTDGYGNGEQQRDFVFVGDVVRLNLFFVKKNPPAQGIFNVGTGSGRTFNDVAKILIASLGKGEIDYIPFPDSLKGKYQSFTQADLSGLRWDGHGQAFSPLESGIPESIKDWAREA